MTPSDTILDIGAGPGFYDDFFRSFPRYYSLDFCPYPNIDIVSDIVEQNLPIRTLCADYVLLSNVLEHVPAPRKLLEEAHRVLKHSGELILIVPFIFKLHQEPYDYLRYTHHMLRLLLEEAGYTEVIIEKLGTIKTVFDAVQYEYNQILRFHARHRFSLRVLLSLQYHLQKLVNAFFYPGDTSHLVNNSLFPAYVCQAKK